MFFRIFQVCGLGVLSFMTPRVLLGLGIPLDVWAQKFGQWINITSTTISDDTLLTLFGVILAVISITAELWFHIIENIIDKFKINESQEFMPLSKAAQILYSDLR